MTRPLTQNQIESLSKLPSLKGPALSILVALLIAERPLQAQELQSFTGYGDNGITSGLRTLQHLRAITDTGKGRGFILAPAWQQLALPLNWEGNREKPDLDDEPNREKPDFLPRNREKPDLPEHHGGGGSYRSRLRDGEPPTTMVRKPNREKPDLVVDNSVDEQPGGGETTPRKAAPEITARSSSPEITAVARWLEKAGVSPASYHWEKIMAMGHKETYVKAHVLELLARQAEISDADDIKTGGLIHRLEKKFGAPAMRCPDCLQIQSRCRCNGGVPPEYQDIIKR